MSESNDPPPRPPSDEPPSSPFPDSSLSSPSEDPPAPPAEPPPSPPPTPHGDPVAPEPPAYDAPAPPSPEPPSSTWTQPSSAPPATPAQPEAREPWASADPPTAPSPPAAPGGFSSGDPLGGSSSGFPGGYTSPPPPGASDYAQPPAQGSFGSSAPAAGQYVLAGWWRRVGAALIDGVILTIPFFLVLSVLGIGFFGDEEGTGDGAGGFIAGFILTTLAFVVVALLYAPLMMAKTNGKTVGRMATGIRVVRAGGEQMTFGFAALREIVIKGILIGGIAGSFTFGLAYLLDVLWPLWDDENRALHDFIVNTRTVMD